MMDAADLRSLLQARGVVVLSGAVHSVADLERLTQSWFDRFHQPPKRMDARNDSQDGFTSRVGVAGYLLGHAEAYYRPCLPAPDVCLFWCQRAPAVAGGETTWVDGAALFNALPAPLAQRLVREQLVYESRWDRSRWQQEFHVHDEDGLKALLDADPSCRYTLDAQGELHLHYQTSALMTGNDGVRRFINGVLAHLPAISHRRYAGNVYCKPSNRIHWEGGGLIHDDALNSIIDAHDAVLNEHRWNDGDLLILDNHRVLHGRQPMARADDRVIYSRFGYWA